MTKNVAAQILGQKGGNATKEKLGIAHYKAISQKAAKVRAENRQKKLSTPTS
jgi:hypothetical protein